MMAVGEVDALRAMGSWRARNGTGRLVRAGICATGRHRNRRLAPPAGGALRAQFPALAKAHPAHGLERLGKSTFLKAVGLCAILAQSVATCPAGAYRARPHAIFSSMSLRDDVLSGASYFMTEIRSVLRIVNYAARCPAWR